MDEAGVADLVEHHAEDSQIVLLRFLGEGLRFDLALVDGPSGFPDARPFDHFVAF